MTVGPARTLEPRAARVLRSLPGLVWAVGAMVYSGGLGAQEVYRQDLSFDDMHAVGVVSLVDKEFVLEGVVTWATSTVKIPEDPRTPAELAALAGPLKVRMQGKSFEGLAGRDTLLLVSDKLTKVKAPDGSEQWAFGAKRLVRDGPAYKLHVRLLLRASFKKELLQNPAFVKQSNQPRYWAQTFELELLGISEVRQPAGAEEAVL